MTGKTTAAAAMLLGAMAATGCVPFVAGTPPARVTTGAGAAVGAPSGEGLDRAVAGRQPVVTGRVAWFPFQVDDGEALGDRRVELGGGYLLEALPRATAPQRLDRHGLFVEIDHYPLQRRVGRDRMLRLMLRGSADFVVDRTAYGGGASFGAGVELSRWADLSIGRQSRRGVGLFRVRGTHGMGLEVGTAYRRLGSTDYWTFTAGLSLRSPSIVGAAFRSLGSFLGLDPEVEEERR